MCIVIDMTTAAATTALRHDIENIPMGIVIIVDGEAFTRLPHWADATRPSQDFARVAGGYNASAGQLASSGFVVDELATEELALEEADREAEAAFMRRYPGVL